MDQNEAMKEFLRPRRPGEMPFILAQRWLPYPNRDGNHNINDYEWEGLERQTRGNKAVWIPHKNFCLKVDGMTGYCKIPDTEFNRARLQKLSKPRTKEKIVARLNDDTGEVEQRRVVEETPPLYKRIDRNVLESGTEDALYESVLARVKKDLKKSGYESAVEEEVIDTKPEPMPGYAETVAGAVDPEVLKSDRTNAKKIQALEKARRVRLEGLKEKRKRGRPAKRGPVRRDKAKDEVLA